MFQASEAPRRSRGTHGEACHGVVLEQSDKRRRTRSSAGRIRERNMAVGRQPGRCPNVGGGLRTATKRQAGLCPATPSGGPKAPPNPRSSLAERALPAIAYLWRLLPAFSAEAPLGQADADSPLRGFVVLSHSFEVARDSLHLTSGWRCHPPRGDFEATCWVGPVGLVGLVGRVPGCRVTQRPVLARTRALQMA
jgi:hypothetical protein